MFEFWGQSCSLLKGGTGSAQLFDLGVKLLANISLRGVLKQEVHSVWHSHAALCETDPDWRFPLLALTISSSCLRAGSGERRGALSWLEETVSLYTDLRGSELIYWLRCCLVTVISTTSRDQAWTEGVNQIRRARSPLSWSIIYTETQRTESLWRRGSRPAVKRAKLKISAYSYAL